MILVMRFVFSQRQWLRVMIEPSFAMIVSAGLPLYLNSVLIHFLTIATVSLTIASGIYKLRKLFWLPILFWLYVLLGLTLSWSTVTWLVAEDARFHAFSILPTNFFYFSWVSFLFALIVVIFPLLFNLGIMALFHFFWDHIIELPKEDTPKKNKTELMSRLFFSKK